jgi:hypothetical protein
MTSSRNSFTHIIATSYEKITPLALLLIFFTSSSTCVVTNLVEEIKELKEQVTLLKKDLVMSHEGKSKLDSMLSVQKSPNDKSGPGFISKSLCDYFLGLNVVGEQ